MKILITHASAGAGHLKAAEALYYGLNEHANHDVVLIDVLDYTSPRYKNLYRNSYSFMVSKIPFFWGFVFWLLDIPFLQPLVRICRRIYNSLNASKFHKFLMEEQFDCIISTHFLPTEVSSALKGKGKISAKIITCVTDYDVHRIWLARNVDLYCVASSFTQEKMRTLHVSQEKIKLTGIPTNEKFSKNFDILSLKKELGLVQDAFTVLIATGSFGMGPIKEMIKALNKFQIVVVCGHNETLFQQLNQIQQPLVKILGLVDNMHELMAVSDVMVTKPGGLSISEALVSQVPMIFFSAIPGQETNNIKVLKQFGIGLSGLSVAQIAQELEKLKLSKDTFLTAVKRTKDLASPNAVKDIISLL